MNNEQRYNVGDLIKINYKGVFSYVFNNVGIIKKIKKTPSGRLLYELVMVGGEHRIFAEGSMTSLKLLSKTQQ